MTETPMTQALQEMFEGIRDERRMYSNTATRIGNAFLSLLSFLRNSPYLSKIDDDTAQGVITFLREIIAKGGIIIGENGEYRISADGKAVISELISSINTFSINSYGDGHMRSLTLDSWLEVPELRYNRVSVKVGNDWRAPGGGIIESVTPLTDSTGTIKLKLQDGEYGALKAGDYCHGIWHFTDEDNWEGEDTDDGHGNFHFKGFTTIYFHVDSVEGVNNDTISYTLRNDASWPLSENPLHPQQGMTVVATSNDTDTDRQACTYGTTEYQRYLRNIHGYEWSDDNIYIAAGKCAGIVVNWTDSVGNPQTTVLGNNVSLFVRDIWMMGTIQQATDATLRMQISYDNGNQLGYGKSTTATIAIIDSSGSDHTADVASWSVTRYTGAADDEEWIAPVITNGILTLRADDIGSRNSAQFSVTATFDSGRTVRGDIHLYRLHGQLDFYITSQTGAWYIDGRDTDGDTVKQLVAHLTEDGTELALDAESIIWTDKDGNVVTGNDASGNVTTGGASPLHTLTLIENATAAGIHYAHCDPLMGRVSHDTTTNTIEVKRYNYVDGYDFEPFYNEETGRLEIPAQNMFDGISYDGSTGILTLTRSWETE